MKIYDSTHMVTSRNLNIHGTLFAAHTAEWFVEAAFAAAAVEYREPEKLVCRNVHGLSFTKPIGNGDIICLHCRVARFGRSSITVYGNITSELTGVLASEGFVTFVVVDERSGRTLAHGMTLDETTDSVELEIRRRANALFESMQEAK